MENNYWEKETDALIFRVGKMLMAFPLLSILEIQTNAKTTPLLGYPDSFLGISSVRGELVTIISLSKLLNIQNDEDCSIDIIVMKDGNTKYALRVNEIIGTENIPASNLKSHLCLNYAYGYAEVNSKLVALSEPEILLKKVC